MDEKKGSTKSLVRESGKLSILTMVSRVLGLIRDRTRGALMGTGMLADSFTVAYSFPNLFRRLFAEGSMAVAFIPTIKQYMNEDDKEKTEEFMSATFTFLVYVLCIVVALGIALAPVISMLYDTDPYETTVLLRIMFPFLALVSVAAFFQGILNAYGVFVTSGFAPILFNLAFIFVPMLVGKYMENPARAMAIGVIVGGCLQGVCQVPRLIKLGARFHFISPIRAFKNPGMRKVLTLIAPTILGMAAYEINSLVSAILATKVAVGAATALTFSLRLQELVLGIFVVSVSTVLLPDLSSLVAEKKWDEYRDRLTFALNAILLVTIPVAAFAISERVDIVSVLFKTKQFDEASVALTSGAFLFHMLGLPFVGANRIFAPAFYARGNTKVPAWAGVASCVVNITVACLLRISMGCSGIAFALSIASAVNTSILVFVLLRSKIEGLKECFLDSSKYALKLLVFSVIAYIPVVLLRNIFKSLVSNFTNNLFVYGLPLVFSAIIFASVGVGLLIVFKDKTAKTLVNSLIKR